MLNLITDLPGIRVGHASDATRISGVTCVLFDRPNVATAIVGGGAPGTRSLSILAPGTINADVDAIVLSGGSAFGLDAAGGVMSVLASRGIGFPVGGVHVPIAAQAIVFDLLCGGDPGPPTTPVYWSLGHEACEAARTGSFTLGSVGGGLGATTATFKGGVGSASTNFANGATVAALTVVNALGSATIGQTAQFWAGDVEQYGEFGGHGWPNSTGHPLDGDHTLTIKGSTPATTISIVATDVALDKNQLQRLAAMANTGLARAIRPANAPMDGDVIFAVSQPGHNLPDALGQTHLGQAAADCLARAIARAVYEAEIPCSAYVGPPAYRDVHTGPNAPDTDGTE